MLNNNVFYHGIIRKTIVAFGSLFSTIFVDRKVGATGIDSVSGDTIQRLQVPIAYAPKEKWIVRIEQDPTLENYTYTTLPRISFEIRSYEYDVARKTNKINKISCHKAPDAEHPNGIANSVYAPVPYNLTLYMYVITKTQEDGLQIIEQILPTFTPDYNITINVIPELNITQDIPVILNSVNVEDNYDGAFQNRRFVIHTLVFTLKINLFGAVSESNRIFTSMANISTKPDFSDPILRYKVKGDPETYQVIPNDVDPESDIWIEDL